MDRTRRAAALFCLAVLMSSAGAVAWAGGTSWASASSPALPVGSSTASVPQPTAAPASPNGAPSLPVLFEPNVGQAPQDVRFVARTGLARTDLSATGFAVQGALGSAAFRFLGSDPNVRMEALDPLGSHTAYLDGHATAPHFASVAYTGLYSGVDLRFHPSDGQVEFDAIVAAGVDASVLRFAADRPLRVDTDGALVADGVRLAAPLAYQGEGTGRHLVPVSYALSADGTVHFDVKGRDIRQPLVIDPKVGFSSFMGGLPSSGPAYEDGFASAKGQLEGGVWYVYATGILSASSERCKPLATCPAAYGVAGPGQAAVAKFRVDVDGASALQWIAIVDGDVHPMAIDVDAGRVYVAGWATKLASPTANAYQGAASTNNGVCSSSGSAPPLSPLTGPTPYAFPDAFLSVLTADGQSLVYNSLLGGNGNDVATGVAAGGGHPVVTGYAQWTSGQPFPTTAGSAQHTHAGPSYQMAGTACASGIEMGGYDAFVARFDPDAAPATNAAVGQQASLLWSTFLGGGGITPIPFVTGGWSMYIGEDYGQDVAVDGAGKVWVVGSTTSTGTTSQPPFPITADADQPTLGGFQDAFVARFSSDGSKLEYSSYLGGPGNETARSFAFGNGALYVTGSTDSASKFRFNGPAYQTAGAGGLDAFVSKFALSPLVRLSSSTLLGSAADEDLRSVEVDGNGDVQAQGYTMDGSIFPRLHAWPALDGGPPTGNIGLGQQDVVLARFDGGLQRLLFATAMGGTGYEAWLPVYSSGVAGPAAAHPGTLVGVGSATAATDPVVVTSAPQRGSGPGSPADWPVAASASNPAVTLPGVLSFRRTFTGGASYEQTGAVARFAGPSEPYVACGLDPATPTSFPRMSSVQFTWNPAGLPHTQGIETYDALAGGDPNFGMDLASFRWDFDYVGGVFRPDASADGQATPAHLFGPGSRLGTHVVVFHGSDTDGRMGEGRCTVSILNAPPVAACAGLPPALAQLPTAFSSAGSVDPDATGTFSYSWDFGDGSPADTAPNPTHTYATPGTYDVQLTVRDGNGATDTASCPLVVQDASALVCAGPSSAHPGQSVQFSAAGGQPPISWASSPDGATAQGPSFTVSYLAAGSYLVSATDSAGRTASCPAFAVQAWPAPSCAPASQDRDRNVAADLAAASGDGTYAWSAPGATPSAGTGAGFAPTFHSTGAMTVTVTSAGQSATCTVRVGLPPCGGPQADFFASSQVPAVGQAVSFTDASTIATGHSIDSYTWDFGDGATSQAQDPVHAFAGPGTYVVRLTAKESLADCVSLRELILQVGTAPSSPATPASGPGSGSVAAPTADAGPDQDVREGQSVQLDGSATGGGDARFLWRLAEAPAGVQVPLSVAGPNLSFTAPRIPGACDATVVYELRATVGSQVSPPSLVRIRIHCANHAPTADAGADIDAVRGALVRLDAANSTDPDGDALAYTWTQTAGTPVTLDTTDPTHPTFRVPAGGPGDAVEFRLTASDGRATSSDLVRVWLAPTSVPMQPATSAGSGQAARPALSSAVAPSPMGVWIACGLALAVLATALAFVARERRARGSKPAQP